MKSLAQSKYQLIAILNGLLMGIICMTLTNYNSSFAITPTPVLVPSNSTIITNITDNLNSITANVSYSIKSTIDKVMSDTLNGMMEDTISLLLKNTTQSVTNDNKSTDVKFEPKIPSSIDITQMPMENKLNPSYEHEVTVS
jgi:hypothetical protein